MHCNSKHSDQRVNVDWDMAETSTSLVELPSDDLEHIQECPACQTAQSVVLHDGLLDRAFGIVAGTWTLHQCKNCGSAFLSPRLTRKAISLAYEGGYYTHSSEEAKELTLRNPLALLRRGIKNYYLNKTIGGNRKPSIPLSSLLLSTFFAARKARLDHSVRHLDRRFGTRILDIGCGNGDFLVQMMGCGWSTFGVEPDPAAADFCRKRGLDVRSSLAEFPDNCVDSITMDHVLEHVHSPLSTLKECLRVLRPRGRIWIATPNIDSLGHERFGQDWRGLEPPRHLVIFSRKAISLLLARAGFSYVDMDVAKECLFIEWAYDASNRIRAQRGQSPFAESEVHRWAKEDSIAPGFRAEELVAIGTKPVEV